MLAVEQLSTSPAAATVSDSDASPPAALRSAAAADGARLALLAVATLMLLLLLLLLLLSHVAVKLPVSATCLGGPLGDAALAAVITAATASEPNSDAEYSCAAAGGAGAAVETDASAAADIDAVRTASSLGEYRLSVLFILLLQLNISVRQLPALL
jgi:uncharacterized integral membrane protein